MNKNLDEISDGKIYGLNDMVRAACCDCAGCSACCEDMGQSVILDPLDSYRLTKHFSCGFEQLMNDYIELHIEDGMMMPHLKMSGEGNACVFLNERKRCSIHEDRPGICRLFPLGRIYEGETLSYFLQSEGCVKENRSKVKVSKWLDTPDLKKNQKYLTDWHAFRKKMQEILPDMEDENQKKTIMMFLLNTFYIQPYDREEDFYPQFYGRLEKIMQVIR